MPELPDVQVQKERLDATALHRRIEHVYVSADRILTGVSDTTLRRRLDGRTLRSSRRHGKHLFAEIEDDGWLRLHFGMTGRLAYYRDDGDGDGDGDGDLAGPPDHTRLRLDFSGGGHLAYVNVRRLGQIGLVDDPDAYVEAEGLGPDALDTAFDAGALGSVLEGRTAAVKSALTDQSRIAGIGNVYADEMLFQARIHPETPAGTLDEDDVRRLHEAMRRVLQAAIEARVEDFPDWFLLPRREEGGRCPRCGAELEKSRVSGRVTWTCPREQAPPG